MSWFMLAVVTFVGNAAVPPATFATDPMWVSKQACLDDLQKNVDEFLEWFKKLNHADANIEFSCEHLDIGRPA